LTKTGALAVLVVAVYVLHQDVWLWTSTRPLVLGFLPPGLAYHALYTLACAALMGLLCRRAWPGHLEPDDADARGGRTKD
jgi:polyferredoxin